MVVEVKNLTTDQELVLDTIDDLGDKNNSIYAAKDSLVSILTTKAGNWGNKGLMTATQLERCLIALVNQNFIDPINSNHIRRTMKASPKMLKQLEEFRKK